MEDQDVHRHEIADEEKVEDQDQDAVLAELENEDGGEEEAERVRRWEQLHAQAQNHQRVARTVGHEPVTTLRGDEEVLRFTTEIERVVLHFCHPDFARCGIMDRHLREVAEAQTAVDTVGPDLRWARVEVTDAPFVVEKMKIRVLPCLVGFRDGVAVGRLVGFEGLLSDEGHGNEDGPSVTRALEKKLIEWKLLGGVAIRDDKRLEHSDSEEDERGKGRRGITGGKRMAEDVDDDWD